MLQLLTLAGIGILSRQAPAVGTSSALTRGQGSQPAFYVFPNPAGWNAGARHTERTQ